MSRGSDALGFCSQASLRALCALFLQDLPNLEAGQCTAGDRLFRTKMKQTGVTCGFILKSAAFKNYYSELGMVAYTLEEQRQGDLYELKARLI